MNRQPFPREYEQNIVWSAITIVQTRSGHGGKKVTNKVMDRISTRGTSVVKRYHEWTHDLCPRCLQPNKICLHVFHYPANSVRIQWEKVIEELEEALVTMRTNPNIISCGNQGY